MVPTTAVALIMSIFSVLVPSKQWYGAEQSIPVEVAASGTVHLIMTDFAGRTLDPAENQSIKVESQTTVMLDQLYPQVKEAGTYLLFAAREPDSVKAFEGTPLVISSRRDRRSGTERGTMVTRIAPLQYAVMQTDEGPLTLAFFYDVAPHTVESFLNLANEGFYDGLTFHRIIPSFVIQGGDPRGDGTGNPGFTIPAEFNDRKHLAGVLSMARQGDPNERSGAMPRPQFADSAGSQFFICLSYEQCRALDGKYTAFGRVMDGMPVVEKIAEAPIGDSALNRPQNPPHMQTVRVYPVTPEHNPYPAMREQLQPVAEQPQPVTTQPAVE